MSDPVPNEEHELFARIARARHELRTPVSAVLAYCETLLEDAEALPYPHFQAGLQEIHILSRRLHDAINELLQPAHLENPAQDLPALALMARRELRPHGEQILEVGQRLLGQAQTVPLSAFLTDLDRILTAAHRFLTHLSEVDVLAPVQPAAQGRLADAALEPVEQESAILAESAEFLAGCRSHILIVDDNAFNRDILARGLLEQKHHFALAGHGKQALEMLSSKAFDLVLLDILMPEMDGFEVLARIKADPELAHTPVIIISALDQIDNVIRCIEMGAADYLPKPFDPVLLRAKVDACLETKRLREIERGVAIIAAAALARGESASPVLAEFASRNDVLGEMARALLLPNDRVRSAK